MSAVCTQLLVSLRNADPAALTALGSIQRSLGFEERLQMVSRRVLWELHGPADADPEPVIEALRRSGEVWNPNKEAAKVRFSGAPLTDLGSPIPGEQRWMMVLAWDPDRDRDRSVAALLPFLETGWRLARGVLWGLCWKEASSEEHRRWSEEAALCRGPTEGLLIHPHIEDHRWIDGTEPPPWLPPGKDQAAR
jgi:hypothetical protein